MNANPLKFFLVYEGFSKVTDANYIRTKNGFINCINFQKKSTGDVFFINMGVHPIFHGLNDQHLPDREIDCYIRSRMITQDELDIDLLDSPDGISHIVSEMKKNWIFFDFFNSVDNVFSSIDVEKIQNEQTPFELSKVTRVMLTLMCMYYHMSKGNKEKSINLAEYGLSIAGMAVKAKKEFKQVIKNIN
jgi:hypothetical protein